jgi:hypothetical protein
MWRDFSVALSLAAVVSMSESACAMSSADRQARCNVVNGDKLPAESGGAAALCSAIESAAAKRAPGVGYSVEVKVQSSSRLAADLVREGHALPQQNYATMDRALTRQSFERFAAALADRIAAGH